MEHVLFALGWLALLIGLLAIQKLVWKARVQKRGDKLYKAGYDIGYGHGKARGRLEQQASFAAAQMARCSGVSADEFRQGAEKMAAARGGYRSGGIVGKSPQTVIVDDPLDRPGEKEERRHVNEYFVSEGRR